MGLPRQRREIFFRMRGDEDQRDVHWTTSNSNSVRRCSRSDLVALSERRRRPRQIPRFHTDRHFTHLPGSCSSRGAPATRPGWAPRRPDRRPDGPTAAWGPAAASRPAGVAASSLAGPLRPPAAAPDRRKCGAGNCGPRSGRCWSGWSVAWRPAVAPPPTSTGPRRPAAPDDNHRKHRCRSPPGGSRRPPAAVRTAGTAPV